MSSTTTRSGRKLIDFAAAKAVYLRGENVTEHLRAQLGVTQNTPEIIETAYDLQAGSYIADLQRHRAYSYAYTSEIADVLQSYVGSGYSLLDIGCGELTTLSLVASKLKADLAALYAFDISWSRIKVGLGFARENMPPALFAKLKPFTADIGEIPLRSKSIDIAVTSHALEPNGGRETDLLSEILRVTRHVAVLFEPSYELNSAEGRERMDRLGYVKNLADAAERCGAQVVAVSRLKNTGNPLNPTAAYVLKPAGSPTAVKPSGDVFSDPGADTPLQKFDGFYFSPSTGLSYPVIQDIPVLRSHAAVLTSALAN